MLGKTWWRTRRVCFVTAWGTCLRGAQLLLFSSCRSVLGVRAALPPSAARPPQNVPGVSAASGAPPARRRVLAHVGPGGTAAAGVPAPYIANVVSAVTHCVTHLDVCNALHTHYTHHGNIKVCYTVWVTHSPRLQCS